MDTPPTGASYYRPSGKLTVQGFVLILLLGGGTGALVGFGYGYLTLYNPLIYFSILATIGLGFLTGFVGTIGLHMGKLRAPLPAALVALVAGGMSVYANWVAWLHGFLGRSDIDMWVLSPGEVWTLMQMVAAQGAWTIKSWTPTGTFLYVFWGLEAAILVGLPAYLCFKAARAPFCERCDQWTQDVFTDLRLGWPDDQAGLRHELETGNIGALARLPSEPGKYTKITLEACPACSQDGYLTVEACTEVLKEKGKKSTEEQDIVRYLQLGPEALQAARRLAEAPPELSGSDG